MDGGSFDAGRAMATAPVGRDGDGNRKSRKQQGGFETMPFILGEQSTGFTCISIWHRDNPRKQASIVASFSSIWHWDNPRKQASIVASFSSIWTAFEAKITSYM
uniref:Predicted protein n=1 Tax=Hordeum vulgare subsp. vulgare TaxID=112509 RepID=F2EFM1_HORVV|nr:predicted protein [Hordeum vulgare subsp. vulgare]